VASHSGDDSTTYSVEVRYSYEVGGRRYQGDRYRFMGGSSSGYDGKAEVVAGLPPGSTRTCWVDPADPTAAVLDRGFGWEILIGLLPLVFVAVGGGGVVWSVRGWIAERRSRRGGGTPGLGTLAPPAGAGAVRLAAPGESGAEAGAGLPSWLPRPAGLTAGDDLVSGAVQLAPPHGPVGRLLGVLFVALFWNGIVSIFLWQVVKGWRTGAGDGCATAFLVPFVLVGVALLGSVPYQLLATFNPRPMITLERAAVAVGGALTVSWSFRGSAGRLRSLKLWVEGEEVATYRRGTDTITERTTFATLPVVELLAPTPLAAGQASFVIPEGSMSSFTAGHNQVEWTLKLAGEIARWPDVAEEYPLLVVPPALLEGGRW
jgi:hypothetical protein